MKRTQSLSRRQFLSAGTATGGTQVLPSALPLLHHMALTPPESFFRQHLRTFPSLHAEAFVLLLDGMLMKPLTFSLAQLGAFPRAELPCTFACIGNRPGGTKIANAIWSGAWLRDVFAEVGVSANARYAEITAADGYTTTVLLSDLDDALLATEINGAALSHEQGAPVRLIVPGLYGYKMPKWISRIVLTDVPTAGFWESQGWSMTGQVQTTAAIWTPQSRTRVTVGEPVAIAGMAYGGRQPIVSVEISVDDGAWMPADLHPRSAYEWTLWHTVWRPSLPGDYLIKVRATDASGYLQPDVLSEAAFPDGASGLHAILLRVGSDA